MMVLASLGACTDEQDLSPEEGGSSTGTPLVVRTAVSTDSDDRKYGPFAKGDAIYVYYDYQNLSNVYPWLRGKYICEEADKTKAWKSDASESIYKEDIKKPNLGTEYWFTAVSLPEPKVEGSSFYEVKSDQTTTGYEESDFKIARAVYQKEWDKATISFHFRHVLSRLRVQLLLPKGKPTDGYFENPMELAVKSAIQSKCLQYGVTFDNAVGDRGILKTTLNGEATPNEIKMHSDGDPIEEKVNIGLNTGVSVATYTFSSIIPKQSIPQGNQLLKIDINGKSYSYIPPKANTVTLEQEVVTTIRLILLSGAGQTKLVLDDVKQTPWKEDRANVGDLFPQDSKN